MQWHWAQSRIADAQTNLTKQVSMQQAQEQKLYKEKCKTTWKKMLWMDKSRIKHFHKQKNWHSPLWIQIRWDAVMLFTCTRQSFRFLYIYLLGRLSFKIKNSPGRLFLMEKRRQYKIGHLLRGYLQGNQKTISYPTCTAKPYTDLDQDEGYRVMGFMA